jgi:hypothetical protein
MYDPEEELRLLHAEWLRRFRPVFIAKFGAAIGSGRNREGYGSTSAIFKLPITVDGMYENAWERTRFVRGPDKNLARCRLLHLEDVPVLAMVLLDTDHTNKNLPDWADFIDCRQVGFDRRGNVRAYDYA